MFGSLFLMISLFLNWFSDKDVFRSGDTYTAINGPLYFVGLSILLMAAFNLALVVMAAMRIRLVTKMSVGSQGKLQMLAGFASMYLLVVINSVYFHPQFGLNILEKKSEIGVMVALASTVLICVGGYLCYRQKFLQSGASSPVQEKVEQVTEVQAPFAPAVEPVYAPVQEAPARIMPAMPTQATATSAAASSNAQDSYFSERDPRGKTDYERTKLYENLKKTMIRDTLTPDQRRKLLSKEAKDNAFSANFGKSGPVVANTSGSNGTRKARSLEETPRKAPATSQREPVTPSTSDSKKPQMYRMDL